MELTNMRQITRRVHHAKRTLHPDDRFIDWVMRELCGASGSQVAYHDAPGLFENKTGDEHWDETRTACIGVSGGKGDEHPANGQAAKIGQSASSLWLNELKVQDPALWRLAEYCRRNDSSGYHEGQTADERAFDLASIIQALNFYHPRITEEEIQLICDYIFTALYWRDKRALEAAQDEFWKGARVFKITPTIFMAAIKSDNPAIESAARSVGVGLVMRQWSSGHIRITPGKMIPMWIMDEVACFVRICQMLAKGMPMPEDLPILRAQGSLPGTEELFYYNRVLQNGMPTRPKTPPFEAVFEKTVEAVAERLAELM